MQNVYREILPGVRLRVISTDKFKTSCFSANFLLPLNYESASENALIPSVLRRGSKRYPDMTKLTSALDSLYGARVEPTVRKFGDVQVCGIFCDLVNSKCVPDGEKILSDTINLALEVLCEPHLGDEGFVKEYVESERDNLIDYLNGEINEKLSYAYTEAVAALYKDSGFGVNEEGAVEKLKSITAKNLYEHYKKVFLGAPLELFFCGDASFEQIEACVLSKLKLLRGVCTTSIVPAKPKMPEYSEICVRFDVLQANLLIGLYTPTGAWDEGQPAMQVLATILGGGTASKLFTHVREEKSLCYYVGAKYDKYLQTMFMYSGVDPKKIDEARREMLKQLTACQEGDVCEAELEVAKRCIIDAFRTNADSALGLESYWLSESIMGMERELELRIDGIRAVEISQVVKAAKELVSCMTYVLTGKEAPYAGEVLSGN